MSFWSAVRTRLLPAALLVASAGAWAAPVQGDTLAAERDELAMQWSLSSLAPPATWLVPSQPLGAPDTTVPSASAATMPMATLPAGGVPDPGAYALMGLVLLGAGVAARAFARRAPGQRGLSKNT